MKDEPDLVQSLLPHDEDVAVPADHERRIREGLGALLGAMPTAPAPPPPAPPPPPPSALGSHAGSALRTWVTTGVVAAVAAGGGFVAGRATAPRDPATEAVTTGTPSPSQVISAQPNVSAPTAAGSASALASASANASASASGASAPAAPATTTGGAPGDGFDREQSLLERARSALVRHDPSAAEKALDEHDHQFPRSRHAEERDYLRIQVLRERGGDQARVRERAKAFLAKYPESMLRARVEPLAQ